MPIIDQFLAFDRLRKIALSSNFLGLQSIEHLSRNCDLLQEVRLIDFEIVPLGRLRRKRLMDTCLRHRR